MIMDIYTVQQIEVSNEVGTDFKNMILMNLYKQCRPKKEQSDLGLHCLSVHRQRMVKIFAGFS